MPLFSSYSKFGSSFTYSKFEEYDDSKNTHSSCKTLQALISHLSMTSRMSKRVCGDCANHSMMIARRAQIWNSWTTRITSWKSYIHVKSKNRLQPTRGHASSYIQFLRDVVNWHYTHPSQCIIFLNFWSLLQLLWILRKMQLKYSQLFYLL